MSRKIRTDPGTSEATAPEAMLEEVASPFSRPMPVALLPRERETKFRVAAERAELDALAPYLEIARIDRLTLAGFISPEDHDGWRIRGRLVASLDQACVITLAHLHARHEAEIERHYLPAKDMCDGPEIRVFHDDDDLPDAYEDHLDPAQLAVESLLLLIDPYPRAEGAELPETVITDGEAPDARQPFAALAALKPLKTSSEPDEDAG